MKNNWISLDFIRFHWISLDFIGFHWISLDFNGFQWISIDFNAFQCISMDFIEFQPPHGPRLRELGLALLPTFGSPAALGGDRDPPACLRSAPAESAESAEPAAPANPIPFVLFLRN